MFRKPNIEQLLKILASNIIIIMIKLLNRLHICMPHPGTPHDTSGCQLIVSTTSMEVTQGMQPDDINVM